MTKTRENLKKLKKQTKWNNIKIIKKLIRAREYGINLDDYIKNRGYKKKKQELIELGEILKLKKEAIKKTQKYAGGGVSKNEAIEIVKTAQKLGITYKKYLNNKCFEFTKEELKEYKEILNLKIINYKERKEYYTKIISEKSNLTNEKSLEITNKLLSKGYTYSNIIMENMYLLSIKEIENLNYKNKTMTKARKKNLKKYNKEIKKQREKVIEEMNWTKGRYRLELEKSRLNCGSSEKEFIIYKLYKKSEKQQKTYITIDKYWKMELKYCDYQKNFIYFKDKELFNKTFKKWINRKWFTNENLSFEEFKRKIKNLDAIVYKPIDSLQGRGFKKFKVNENEKQNKRVYKYIIKQPKGIIEEFIVQHKDMAKFNNKSCNTIRIATINIDGKLKILGTVLRMGLYNDYDNWSVGGVVTIVDPKTGKIIADASDKKGHIYKKHPITNQKFKGEQIPKWNEVLKVIKEVVNVVDNMPYIGWDISITKDGKIELIEGNHNQDLCMIQSAYALLKDKGIIDRITPYLNK